MRMTDECDKWYVRAYRSLPCILLTPNNSLFSTRLPGSPGCESSQHCRSVNLVARMDRQGTKKMCQGGIVLALLLSTTIKKIHDIENGGYPMRIGVRVDMDGWVACRFVLATLIPANTN